MATENINQILRYFMLHLCVIYGKILRFATSIFALENRISANVSHTSGMIAIFQVTSDVVQQMWMKSLMYIMVF